MKTRPSGIYSLVNIRSLLLPPSTALQRLPSRAMALPGTESLRFRRPTSGPNYVAPNVTEVKVDQFGSQAPRGWKRRHQGLLQDKVGRWAWRSLSRYY